MAQKFLHDITILGSDGSTATIQGAGQSTLNLKTTTNSKNNYIVGTTSGSLSFRPNGTEALVLNSSQNAVFAADIFGKSVDAQQSKLYRFGGLFFTWDSDNYGTNDSHSIRSTYGNTYTDSITLNSYNHIRFNIDANNNNSTSYFELGDGVTDTSNVIFRVDQDGDATFSGTTKAATFLINRTSAAGVGASLGDINSAELGPGYLSLSRDDTADAKQILFEKNDIEHGYIKTKSSSLILGSDTAANTIALQLHHSANPVSLGVNYSGGAALAFIESVHSSYDTNTHLLFKPGGTETWRIGSHGTASSSVFLIKPASNTYDFHVTNASGTPIITADSGTLATTFGGDIAIAGKMVIGDATNQHQWIVNKAVSGYYSGIKLTRGTGNNSNPANNNHVIWVSDTGLNLGKTNDATVDSFSNVSTHLTLNASGNATFGGKVRLNSGGTNSEKNDFSVGTGGNPTLSLYGNDVQVGGSDINWNAKFSYTNSNTYLQAWDNDVYISTIGSNTGSATARNIYIQPQAAGTGAATTSAQFRANQVGFPATSGTFTNDKIYVSGDAYTTGGWRVGTGATFVGKTHNDSGKMTFYTDGDRDFKFRSENNDDVFVIDTSLGASFFKGDVAVNSTTNPSGAPLHVGSANGGNWNDGIVIDDPTGWCAVVYKRDNSPKMFTGLYSGSDNYIKMGSLYSNTGTAISAPRADAIMQILPGTDTVEHYLPNYFGQSVGIGTTNVSAAQLEVAKDNDTTVKLLRLRNSDSTYAQTFDFDLDTAKDLVITGSSSVGGFKFVPGSRGALFESLVAVTTGKSFRLYNAAGNGWGEITLNETDNKIQFNRGITPSGNEQADQTLGLALKRWHTVYAHDGNFSGDGDFTGTTVFKHGSTTFKTTFGHGNEINTETAAGANATMYLNYRSGAVNIANSALSVSNAGNSTIKGHLIPHADSTYDIGTSATRFANIYADTLYGDGSNLTSVTSTDSSKLPLAGGSMSGNIQLNSNRLQFDQSGTRSWQMFASSGNLYLSSGDANGTWNMNNNLYVAKHVQMDGALQQGAYSEKNLLSGYFTNGTANLGINIVFPNTQMQGMLKITLSGSYSHQNITGELVKTIPFGWNAGSGSTSGLYGNGLNASVKATGGIADAFTIGNITWNSSTSKYNIPIYHINSFGNSLRVKVEYFGGQAHQIQNISLTAPASVTIPTAFASTHSTHFEDNVTIGRNGAADVSLTVQDGASGAPIKLRSNGGGECFLDLSSNASINRTGGDLNIWSNGIEMEFSTNNGGTNALALDTSHNATFAGNVDVRGGGSGYDAIRLVNNTTADNNKQTGITTLNYAGNNVSIMQYATNSGANTVYYGSADGSHRGLQNHKFMVNTGVDTASSGHTTALHIASNSKATFNGHGEFNTGLKINAPDSGGAPAITAILDMHGYEGRGVGIKMKDNVNSASGATDREWFVGTGYNQAGFNIGYASDGSQSSYAAQSKLTIGTNGNLTSHGQTLTVAGDNPYIKGTGTGAMRIKHTSGQTMYLRPDETGALSIFEGANSQVVYMMTATPTTNSTSNESAKLAFHTRSKQSDGQNNSKTAIIKHITHDIGSNYGTLDFAGTNIAKFNMDLEVTGNLNITGDINSTNVTNLDVTDKTITVAKGAADSAAADGAGIVVDGASASILYDDTGTQWESNKPLEVQGKVISTTAEAQFELVSTHGRTSYINQGGGNLHIRAAHGSGVGINYGDTTNPGYLRLYNNTTAKITLNATSGTGDFDGNISHTGLTMTTGTDIDQIYQAAMTFQLAAETWTDTGIDGTDLTTGTYAVQMYVSDFNVGGGHYYEHYSGMMSWYGPGTNSTKEDEIPLHRAGHAPNNGHMQLKTARHGSGTLMLMVKSTLSYSAALDNSDGGKIMRFKFRRLI